MNMKKVILGLVWCCAVTSAKCVDGGVAANVPQQAITSQHGIKGFDFLPDGVKRQLDAAGWLKRPGIVTLAKGALWAGVPIGLSIYLNHVLKRDKKARLLKLKKEQPQTPENPMAQLLLMMQAQNGGGLLGGGDALDAEAIDALKTPQEPVDSTWNENHILSPHRRKALEVLQFFTRAASVLGIVNAVNIGVDVWRGNRIPSRVRHSMNEYFRRHKIIERRKVAAEGLNSWFDKERNKQKAMDECDIGFDELAKESKNMQQGLAPLDRINARLLLEPITAATEYAQESSLHNTMHTIGLPVLANLRAPSEESEE